jgi:hypothetical protein
MLKSGAAPAPPFDDAQNSKSMTHGVSAGSESIDRASTLLGLVRRVEQEVETAAVVERRALRPSG